MNTLEMVVLMDVSSYQTICAWFLESESVNDISWKVLRTYINHFQSLDKAQVVIIAFRYCIK